MNHHQLPYIATGFAPQRAPESGGGGPVGREWNWVSGPGAATCPLPVITDLFLPSLETRSLRIDIPTLAPRRGKDS